MSAGELLDQDERRAVDTLRLAGGFDVEIVEATGRPDKSAAPAAAADPAPAQRAIDEPPASTVAYVRQLLADYDSTRPRSTQTNLGPSELGTPCRRQIALKLAGFPQPQDGHPWAPLQGVAMHALMEDVLEFDNAGRPGLRLPVDPAEIPGRDDGVRGPVWVVEGEVVVDDQIRGHSDAFLVDDETVVDWKYTGTTARRKLAAAKRRGDPPAKQVSQEYRVQAHLYGYASRRAGRDVRWVRVVFLARSHDFDESDEWTEQYREDVAEWAITRYYDIVRQVDALQLRDHPERWVAVQAAPSSDACKFCPFRGGKPCPGDEAAAKRSGERFAAGLV